MIDGRFRERIHRLQPVELPPPQLLLSTSALQSLEPDALYQKMEPLQRIEVGGNTVVAIVAAQYLAEPAVLFGHRHVPPCSHLHSQLCQLPIQPRCLRPPLDRELSRPGAPTIVGEPQKRERLRPPQTCLRSSFGREQPKLNEPGLALIER